MRNASALIVTDEAEFARLATACWHVNRNAPDITVLGSRTWRAMDSARYDLVIVGPLQGQKLPEILGSLEKTQVGIVYTSPDLRDIASLRNRYPQFVYLPLREDWTQILVLVAKESLRLAQAVRAARLAEQNSAKNEQYATLGRYMTDMKHSVNNALTSMLGNAELLLIEPGQLSTHSLAQIKTIHSMALRINEIMQRFSLLSSEMQEAETGSQAETQVISGSPLPHD